MREILPVLSLTATLVAAQPSLRPEIVARMDDHLAGEVRKTTLPLNDPAIGDYVEQLGRRIARHTSPDQSWVFEVIADPACGSTHEPMALPGGQIFVPVHLILAARNESELGGMMAHAMTHVVAGHFAPRPMPRSSSVNATIPLMIFIGGWGAADGDQMAIPLAMVSTRRAFELEADCDGARLAAESGFDPRALGEYIARTQKVYANPKSSVLPERDERVAALHASVANLNVGSTAASEQFEAIQQHARELTAPRRREPPTLKRVGEQ